MGITVITDFDGTITKGDFPVKLLDKYCKEEWRKYDILYRRGKLSLRELIELEVESLEVEPEELGEFAKKHLEFRSGFWEFYGSILDHGIKLMIVSEGLKEYITPFFNPEIRIYANEMGMEDGKRTFVTPYASEECRDCGNCKKNTVQAEKEKGNFVIYIGDGESDFCASQYADMRFARDALAMHLSKKGEEFILFDSFYDILDVIEKMY